MPFALGIYKHLETYIENKYDSAHLFAVELRKQLDAYFGYVTNPEDPEYTALYVAATYLSPVHKVFLTPVLIKEARKFLKGKLLYIISYSLVVYDTFQSTSLSLIKMLVAIRTKRKMLPRFSSSCQAWSVSPARSLTPSTVVKVS